MRTMLRSKVTLLFLTLGLLLAVPAIALADNVVNDVVAGGNDTITAGGSTTITYKIAPAAAGDPQAGCNASDGSPATVNLSVPAGVTASQTSFTFTDCAPQAKSVAFSSNTAGNYPINVSSISDSGTGSYNNQANFTLHVNAATPSDTTGPVITPTIVGTLGNNGWYTSDVDLTWSVTDPESDISSQSGCGAVHVTSDQQETTYTCEATSAGGTSSKPVTIKRDATNPNVALNSGPADGQSYYFGSVPSAPTCTASDDTSGLTGACSVSGYGTTVGSHTVTATATDNAGNENTASSTYTVLAWTLKGFYAPVDYDTATAKVWNTVKGGATVPLKFEVFAGSNELTDTAVVDKFTATGVTCPGAGATTDDIEITTTGGTQLRYDTTAGQFIQNWQTPKKPGSCYDVTMQTDDGSKLPVAHFMLK